MKLVSSAIRFHPKDSDYPVIVCGKRHHNCLEYAWTHQIHDLVQKSGEQGFMTDEGQFVDRYEAYWIAVQADQLLPEAVTQYADLPITQAIPLYSEDVW